MAGLIPGGLDLQRGIQQAIAKPMPGAELAKLMPWSTQLPPGIRQMLATDVTAIKGRETQPGEAPAQGMPAAAGNAAVSMMLGNNPPYAAVAKSAGTPASSEDIQKLKFFQDDHTQKSLQLSAEALGGALTPAKWHQQQHDMDLVYRGNTMALMKNDPHAVNGAEGLTSRWEDTYTQATRPDGQIDYDKLHSLQAGLHYDASQMATVQNVLSKNAQAVPMKALYQKTLDTYDRWQNTWATQNGNKA